MTTQILLRLPPELVLRFRQAVPARQRSSFIRTLLEAHLPDTDEALHQAAMRVESHDKQHGEELRALSVLDRDGLDVSETFDTSKLQALCR
jgi:hypothetical protein